MTRLRSLSDVRPASRGTEIEVRLDELAQADVVSERGRQEEPRVGHQAIVIEGRVEAVEGVG